MRFDLTIQNEANKVRYAELSTNHDAVASIEIVAREAGLLNEGESIVAVKRLEDAEPCCATPSASVHEGQRYCESCDTDL